jgi:methionyl-tRNA formyltransferase
MNIVISTIKSWNIENAELFQGNYSGHNVYVIKRNQDLIYETIDRKNPEWVFFPHWSWPIPREIYETFKCVVFHMTDLPFGRGGTPLQNLISRKIFKTRISAIKVTNGIDEGDIYWQSGMIDIGFGSANEILKKISDRIFNDGIPYILDYNPIPQKQEGRVVHFDRWRDSELKRMNDVEDYYDFIRMSDGEGYPRATISHRNIVNDIKIKFFDAKLEDGKVTGRFEIAKDSDSGGTP